MCCRLLIAAAAVLSALETTLRAQDLAPRGLSFAATDPWLDGLSFDRVRAARAAAKSEPLTTDRPDFTEASSVVGLGIVQLESGYTYSYRDDERDGSITHGHTAPEFLWRVGIHENVELRFIWNYAWERSTLAGTTASPEGADDFSLGAKFALLDQDEFVPETALITALRFSSGAREFRTEDVGVDLNLLYAWELPNEWTIGASTGMSTDTEDVPLAGLPAVFDRDGHVTFHQSIALGVPLTETVGMYIEYFGLYSAGRNANFPENYVNGGFTKLLSDDVQLDVRAGKGLNDQADDFFGGVGLSVRF